MHPFKKYHNKVRNSDILMRNFSLSHDIKRKAADRSDNSIIIPTYLISRIYQVICRHKLLTQQFKNYPMIFALFIVATIFTLCQTVRCIGNILDGYVFWKYKCFENVDDDFNSRIWGMPSWNYILKVLMRIMLIINR